jgi:hypothetical protein
MTKDQKINWGLAGGTIIAFLVGWRRVAGALLAGSAVYDYNQRRPKTAAAEGVAGALFLLMPDWPESLAGAFKSSGGSTTTIIDKTSTPAVPIIPVGLKQSSFDADLGSGWTMLDVQGMRDPKLNPDTDAHVGMTASLVLQNKNADPKVFNAKIIGNTGDDYNGVWAGGAPAGGPQAIDFRGANIFTLHA